MRNDCYTCKYGEVNIQEYPCKYCICENNVFSHYILMLSEPKQSQNSARRDDASKLRMDLIPPEILTGFSRAATYGVAKYDARNCEKGMAWGRAFGSAMRHLWKFWSGETHDQESGIHHLDMAFWNVGMLLVYVKRKIGEDDREDAFGDDFELQFDPEEVQKK